MTQIALAVHYEGQSDNDHYSTVLVESDKEPQEMMADIRRHWEDFQETEPDSDGQFTQYLRDQGYLVIPGEPILLVLNG